MLKVTEHFFDSKKVLRAVDKATHKVLSKFGSFVRSDARRSIKNRKKPSKPGQSPTNQTGLLKGHIYFYYGPATKSVVIGPARLARSKFNNLPTLEYGGAGKVKTKKVIKNINVKARPFMTPAFNKNKQKMPQMWRDSVRRY
ncbi:MAG: hypothetical protein JEZ07_08945 [Phycisphaerae bacterium]|nr:hypothetical protein [Phycisphaerae bacterium]